MKHPLLIVFIVILLLSCNSQQPDGTFDTSVSRPAYRTNNPTVSIDEAHENIHTADGTYKPFAELLQNDGYIVESNTREFSASSLSKYSLLIISNAKGKSRKYDPAFSKQECEAVVDWVRNGGNLLLIADHHPCGMAAQNLASEFGVHFNNGFTNDSIYFDSSSATSSSIDGKSQLVFSRSNGLLGNHPILVGRDSTEIIRRIICFTGQSMRGPSHAASFLTLSPHAVEVAPDSIWEEPDMIFFTKTFTRFADPFSVAGASQGIAMEFGKGRVVILGEAAMLTAQKSGGERFGMQLPGIDNKQLALNIMHWLSRVL